VLLSACGDGPVDAIELVPGGLSDGLVAHWTFDDGAGNVVSDSSGNLRNGTITSANPDWLAQGQFGGALRLNLGDFVIVNSFPDASKNWTISSWVQIASEDLVASTDATANVETVISTEKVFQGGWEMNLGLPTTGTYYHFGYWTGPGQYDYDYFDCEGCFHPGQWQHLSVVVDGGASTLAFFLDGVLQVREPITRTISPGLPTLYMGRWADPGQTGERFLVGSLDDIAIWSRALAAQEIALLDQAPPP
jgi:hypothetical protein